MFLLNSPLTICFLYHFLSVIVNGSDGFGKAYAGQLAARGMNILLVGSDMETLRTVTIEFGKYENQFAFITGMELVWCIFGI